MQQASKQNIKPLLDKHRASAPPPKAKQQGPPAEEPPAKKPVKSKPVEVEEVPEKPLEKKGSGIKKGGAKGASAKVKSGTQVRVAPRYPDPLPS